jgi:outer membrane protein assembly factor BamB
MMNKASIFLIALFLGACGSEDNSEPPTELVEFEQAADINQLWSTSIGDGVEQRYLKLYPLLLDDRLIITDRDGEVTALDIETGKELWTTKLDVVVSGGVGGNRENHLITTRDGEVILLDASGKEKWRGRASSETLVPPVIDDDVVIVRSVDGQMTALSLKSGEEVWANKHDVPALSLRGNSRPLVKHGRIYNGLDNGRLIVLDSSDGRTLFDLAIAVPKGRSELERMVDIDGDAAFENGVLYMASYQGRVVAIDVRRGQLAWTRNLSTATGVEISGSGLFSSDARDNLWALDRSNGATLWKQEKLKARQLTKPVVMGETLVVGDFEGYLHWLSQYDGHFIARVEMDGAGILVPPIVKNDRLYVVSREGEVAAYQVKFN